jgi:hypothetical protein
MTTTDLLNNLRGYVIENAKSYPKLKEDIYGLFCLCQDEIADGGSPQHEIDLCIGGIEDLIKEYNEGKS